MQRKLVIFLYSFISLSIIAQITIFVRQRSTGSYDDIDAHAGIAILLVFTTWLLHVLFVSIFINTFKFISNSSARFLVYYYFLCILSALWSSNFEYTFYRAIEFTSQLFAVLMVFYVNKDEDFYTIERWLLGISIIVIIMGVLLNLKLYKFTITLANFHTNSYSASAVIPFSYCIGELLSKRESYRRTLILCAVVTGFFVFIGTSTGSYIAALFGLTLALLLSRRYTIGIALITLIPIVILFVDQDDLLKIIYFGKPEEKIGSMSGRDHLWQNYWELFLRNPLLGYGLAMGNRIAKYYATNTHNSLFAILLSTGMIGSFTFLIGVIILIKELIINFRKKLDGSNGCFAALSAGAVNAMSISLIGDYWMVPSLVVTSFWAFHVIKLYKVERQKDLL